MDLCSDWQPTALISHLKQRAKLIAKIRDFFAERDVLEVETPLLCYSTATDPHIQSFETLFSQAGGNHHQKLFLQTSPEFPMKRLIAAGVGSIYQICKAFRNEESGRLHNPEFTILEWYRMDFDHHQLMDEVDSFLHVILNSDKAKRITYHQLFVDYLQIEPHVASDEALQNCAQQKGLVLKDTDLTRDDWLQLLMSHFIEPQLGFDAPVFVYDFPASQAALSKIRNENPLVAERFEVYIQGLEIANGYHELCESNEQQKRFESDQHKREVLGRSAIPLDTRLLAALAQGMPACAGIALGIDRLVMLALQRDHIADVIAFPVERA